MDIQLISAHMDFLVMSLFDFAKDLSNFSENENYETHDYEKMGAIIGRINEISETIITQRKFHVSKDTKYSDSLLIDLGDSYSLSKSLNTKFRKVSNILGVFNSNYLISVLPNLVNAPLEWFEEEDDDHLSMIYVDEYHSITSVLLSINEILSLIIKESKKGVNDEDKPYLIETLNSLIILTLEIIAIAGLLNSDESIVKKTKVVSTRLRTMSEDPIDFLINNTNVEDKVYLELQTESGVIVYTSLVGQKKISKGDLISYRYTDQNRYRNVIVDVKVSDLDKYKEAKDLAPLSRIEGVMIENLTRKASVLNGVGSGLLN